MNKLRLKFSTSEPIDLANPPRPYQYQQCLWLFQTWAKRLAGIAKHGQNDCSPDMRKGLNALMPYWERRYVPLIKKLATNHLQTKEGEAANHDEIANGWSQTTLKGVDKDEDLRKLWNELQWIDISLGSIEEMVLANMRDQKLLRELSSNGKKKPSHGHDAEE